MNHIPSEWAKNDSRFRQKVENAYGGWKDGITPGKSKSIPYAIPLFYQGSGVHVLH